MLAAFIVAALASCSHTLQAHESLCDAFTHAIETAKEATYTLCLEPGKVYHDEPAERFWLINVATTNTSHVCGAINGTRAWPHKSGAFVVDGQGATLNVTLFGLTLELVKSLELVALQNVTVRIEKASFMLPFLLSVNDTSGGVVMLNSMRLSVADGSGASVSANQTFMWTSKLVDSSVQLSIVSSVQLSIVSDAVTLNQFELTRSSLQINAAQVTLSNAALTNSSMMVTAAQEVSLNLQNATLTNVNQLIDATRIDLFNVTTSNVEGQFGARSGGRMIDCVFDVREKLDGLPVPPVATNYLKTVEDEEAEFYVSNCALVQNISCSFGQVAPLDGLLDCRDCDGDDFSQDSVTCGACAPGQAPVIVKHAHCSACDDQEYSVNGTRCLPCWGKVIDGHTACVSDSNTHNCPSFRFESTPDCPLFGGENMILYIGAVGVIVLIGLAISFVLKKWRQSRNNAYQRLTLPPEDA